MNAEHLLTHFDHYTPKALLKSSLYATERYARESISTGCRLCGERWEHAIRGVASYTEGADYIGR